ISLHCDLDRDGLERDTDQGAGQDAGHEVLGELDVGSVDLVAEDRAEHEQQNDRQRHCEDHRLDLPEELLDLDDATQPADAERVTETVDRSNRGGGGNGGHRVASTALSTSELLRAIAVAECSACPIIWR